MALYSIYALRVCCVTIRCLINIRLCVLTFIGIFHQTLCIGNVLTCVPTVFDDLLIEFFYFHSTLCMAINLSVMWH